MIQAEALEFVHELISNGDIRRIARNGFIQDGRGITSVLVEDGQYSCVYLPRAAVEQSLSNDWRKVSLLNFIDSYQPLTQALVTITTQLDEERVKMSCCLLSLEEVT